MLREGTHLQRFLEAAHNLATAASVDNTHDRRAVAVYKEQLPESTFCPPTFPLIRLWAQIESES